jgi:hypothetical protein
MLVISYANRALAHCCTKLEVAQETLGSAEAQALIDLIADAEAFENVAELIEFYDAEVMSGDSLAVPFSPSRNAILEPVGKKIPRSENGKPMWEQIRRLKLVNIQEA